jgi:hypothetical protein
MMFLVFLGVIAHVPPPYERKKVSIHRNISDGGWQVEYATVITAG